MIAIKIFISLSGGPTLKIEKYTADSGLFMSASIKEKNVQKILDLCKKLGVGTDKFTENDIDSSKLHCTLMYSPEKCPAIEHVNNIICDNIVAKIACIKYWTGHDKKTYVVAGLEGEKLHEIHNALTDAGAEATFSPYVPHITLYTTEDKLEPKMLRAINEINTELVNRNINIEMYCNPPSNIVRD